jgi:hypothetical protein
MISTPRKNIRTSGIRLITDRLFLQSVVVEGIGAECRALERFIV